MHAALAEPKGGSMDATSGLWAGTGRANITPPVGIAHAGWGAQLHERAEGVDQDLLGTGHHWGGPFDPTVAVARIDDEHGQPLATLVNYGCHPTTAGPENRQISPDYPGVVRQVVEQALGGRCLFLQGAAGDVGPLGGF